MRSTSAWKKGATVFAHHFSTIRPKGGEGHCDSVCEGDRKEFCGGIEKSSVYSMHDCANLPPTNCKVPPSLVPHAKSFVSVAYGNRDIPCSNLKLIYGDSGENNHCEVECLPPYALANNTLQCVARGDPFVRAYGQYSGGAVCVPPSCGMSPELPNARGEQRKVVFGVHGTVTYQCNTGHVTESGLAQFNISCQADGTFTNASSCLPVVCGKPPQISFAKRSTSVNASIVYPGVVSYECNSGYEMSDRSTEFDIWCTAQGSFTPEYSDVMKPCRPVACGSPVVYDNAHLVRNVTASIVYPQQVRYRCNVGYSLDGRAQDESNNTFFLSSCLSSGTFSPLKGPCVPVICGVLRYRECNKQH